jgi:hypothetical protein
MISDKWVGINCGDSTDAVIASSHRQLRAGGFDEQ